MRCGNREFQFAIGRGIHIATAANGRRIRQSLDELPHRTDTGGSAGGGPFGAWVDHPSAPDWRVCLCPERPAAAGGHPPPVPACSGGGGGDHTPLGVSAYSNAFTLAGRYTSPQAFARRRCGRATPPGASAPRIDRDTPGYSRLVSDPPGSAAWFGFGPPMTLRPLPAVHDSPLPFQGIRKCGPPVVRPDMPPAPRRICARAWAREHLHLEERLPRPAWHRAVRCIWTPVSGHHRSKWSSPSEGKRSASQSSACARILEFIPAARRFTSTLQDRPKEHKLPHGKSAPGQ